MLKHQLQPIQPFYMLLSSVEWEWQGNGRVQAFESGSTETQRHDALYLAE